MGKWTQKLAPWQRLALATFFGLLGCSLWFIPFFFETKEMAKGEEASWPMAYYFFIGFGTMAIAISLNLGRIGSLFNIGTGFLGKYLGKKADNAK